MGCRVRAQEDIDDLFRPDHGSFSGGPLYSSLNFIAFPALTICLKV